MPSFQKNNALTCAAFTLFAVALCACAERTQITLGRSSVDADTADAPTDLASEAAADAAVVDATAIADATVFTDAEETTSIEVTLVTPGVYGTDFSSADIELFTMPYDLLYPNARIETGVWPMGTGRPPDVDTVTGVVIWRFEDVRANDYRVRVTLKTGAGWLYCQRLVAAPKQAGEQAVRVEMPAEWCAENGWLHEERIP